MKHVKLFENFDLNETGEWSRDMDWLKTKGMSDEEVSRDDQAAWIRRLEDLIKDVEGQGADLEIEDIKGFDMYQGPYATVTFEKGARKGTYSVWTAENDELFIEDYPEGNTDRGFVGTTEEVANLFK